MFNPTVSIKIVEFDNFIMKNNIKYFYNFNVENNFIFNMFI